MTDSEPEASHNVRAARYSIAQPRPGGITRSRLLEQLDTALKARLLLVVAPEGFGKTTLLAQWALRQRDSGKSVGWLTLEADDNEVPTFLADFEAALGPMLPAAVDELPGDTALEPDPFPATLLNRLAALPTDFTLVLDDYQCIEATAVHRAAAYLLNHPLPRFHLIIGSRIDPPLPLARLRARGELIEVRAADLRFTSDESARFLQQTMGLHLPSGERDVLITHAEGWIAALNLAAASLGGRTDEDSLKHIISTPDIDALIAQAFARQPEKLQRFLLDTSILDRLSGPLCDVVTGGAHSQATLEALAQANLFVVPLDERRRWYRCHEVFVDFLRGRLLETQPERVPELHRRAAQWYARNGQKAEALDHALAVKGEAWALALVEAFGWSMLDRRKAESLLHWLDALPDEIIRPRPRLCLLHAWAHLFTGALHRLNVIEARLQEAQAGLSRVGDIDESDPDSPRTVDLLAALDATVALIRGDMPRTIAQSRKALDGLSPHFAALRGAVALTLGQAYRVKGALSEAINAFKEAAIANRAAGNVRSVLVATCQLGYLYLTQGRLNHAARAFWQVLQHEQGAASPPLAALAHAGLSNILLEWHDLDTAAYHAGESIRLAEALGEGQVLLNGYLAQAAIAQAQHRPDAADWALEQVSELLSRADLPAALLAEAHAQQAQLWLNNGAVAAAVRWSNSLGSAPLHVVQQITLARLLLAQDRPDEAQRLLFALERSHEIRLWQLIEVVALQALAFQARGRTAQALRALERALMLAEPEGYAQVFTDKGAEMARLLSRITSPYAARLRAAFGEASIETLLTERELDVLRLIIAGQSNHEIAQTLAVTVETVKWHVKNVYRKLDVTTRTQAIARAKSLRLGG